MKKIALSLFVMLFSLTAIYAQSSKSIKSAKSKLQRYNLNPETNVQALQEAKDLIDKVSFSELMKEAKGAKYLYKGLLTKGDVYLELSGNPLLSLKFPDAAITSYKAYKQVFEGKADGVDAAVEVKGHQKKDALKGMRACVNPLRIKGDATLKANDYAEANKTYESILDIAATLEKANEKLFDTDADEIMQNIKYIAGATAANLGKDARAKELMLGLYESKFKDFRVYKILFELTIKEDEEQGLKYLQEGRAAFPDEKDLLFSEINYFLGKGELDALESRLISAIEKDPENHTLYYTLGSVYDNLSKDEKDAAKAQGLFDKAKKYYELAISKKPDNFDPYYNIGAMYYNKAVEVIKAREQLPFSAKTEYDAMTKKSEGYVAEAMPFFTKAEELDPKSKLILLAMKEVYARKGDFAKSNEYKARLEALKE